MNLIPEEDVGLVDLIGDGPSVTPFSGNGAAVEAGKLSLMAGSNEEALGQYDYLMDAFRDQDVSPVQALKKKLQAQNKEATQQQLLGVLSDSSVSIEEKQQVVDAVRNGALEGIDTDVILASEALIADSKDETDYASDVRINTADWLEETVAHTNRMQSIVNAVKASRDTSLMEDVGNLLERVLTPVEMGISLATVQSAMKEVGMDVEGDALAPLLLPGTAIETLRTRLANMDFEKREEFAMSLINILNENSGLLVSDSNQSVLLSNIEAIFGDYDDTDKYLDNIFNVLDIVGIGSLAKSGVAALRGGKKAVKKGAANAESFTEVAPSGSQQNPSVPVAQLPGNAKVDLNAAKIKDLEDKHSDLIATAGNKLDKGEVARLNAEKEQVTAALAEKTSVRDGKTASRMLDRRQDLQNTLERINKRLEGNANAVQAEAQLKEIEGQLASLRKRGPEYAPATLNPLADAIRRATMQGTVVDDMPKTAASILYNTNPERARNVHAATFFSQTDEVAVAMYGVGRNEALLKGIIPQVTTEGGAVRAAPVDVEKTTRALLAEEGNVQGLQFTPAELASAKAEVVNNFKNITGLDLHSGMSSFSSDGNKLRVSAVYTNGNGGWKTPEHAREQAQYALRHYGVAPEDIEILRKEGIDYVPLRQNEAKGVEGDYVVRLSFDKNIEVEDIKDWSDLDVKRNFFDRIPKFGSGMSGSLSRHLFEPASMLHPTLIGSSVAAVDRTSKLAETLLQKATKFSDAYAGLSKARQAKAYDYIREANLKELAYNPQDLKARGFTDKEIDMLKAWRDVWDDHFYLENLDIARTLRQNKFEVFENANDFFIVKPVSKNRNINMVYDAQAGHVRGITADEIDVLYDNGGTLAAFRRPEAIGGQTVEHMIVRQNVGEYTRAIRDADRILNKKEGYYQITYKAPRFIEETYKDTSGEMRTRVVGVAGTRKEADEAVKLFQNQNSTSTFSQRGDERGIIRSADEYWDLNSVGGRIAQRHRGKLLENAVGTQHFGKGDFIESPADSAIKAIMSISGRTAMRPVLDAAKERFIRQFGKYLTEDPTSHTLKFPQSYADIKAKGEFASKGLADARTTFEYIRYLENGYVNMLDVASKAAFNVVGEFASKTGSRKLERAASHMEGKNLTADVKGAVFGAFLASNPLRQWIVQPIQVTRTMAYNPRGWINGEIPSLMYDYAYLAMGGKTVGKDSKEFYDFVKSTGMLQAVSKNNLIRGTILDISDRKSSALSPRKVTEVLRKAGFDVGEMTNILGHSAAVFEKYKRAGHDVTKAEVRNQMHQEARALMWDMNSAGDMPYNQNALSLVMTYMQVPHKAILTAVNRRLTRAERARLVTADMAMWGVPVGTISAIVGNNWLPDDPVGREIVTDGLSSVILNKTFSAIANEDISIDWSSLAPNDMDGWREMYNAFLFDGGVKAMIDRSPAAQVFGFSGESRLGMALKTTAGFFVDSFRDEEIDPTTLMQVVDSWGRISSGWNNYQKARAMYALGVAKDKSGKLTDTDVKRIEAFAQGFGFGTMDTKHFYENMIGVQKTIQEREDQMRKDAKEMLQLIAMRHNNMLDSTEVMRLMINSYTTDLRNDEELNRFKIIMAEQLFNDPETNAMKQLNKILGFQNPSDFADFVRQAPLEEEKKQRYLDVFNSAVNSLQKEN